MGRFFGTVSVDNFLAGQLAHLNPTPKPQRVLGGGEEYLIFMSDDFDAPLDDFEDYM